MLVDDNFLNPLTSFPVFALCVFLFILNCYFLKLIFDYIGGDDDGKA